MTRENQKPRTLLVFPPYWEPSSPYLSLPTLTSYLRQRGYPVDQMDLNLMFFSQMIDPDYLARKVQERMPILRQQNVDPQQILAFLPHITWAKSVFRSQDFYNVALLEKANNVWVRVCQIINLLYPTSNLTLFSFDMQERPSSSAEVIKAAHNRLANPFLEFYESCVLPQLVANPPDILGLSIARDTQMIPGFTLAALVRKHLPQVHITVGGAYFTKVASSLGTGHPHPAFEHLIHSAVKGEGEEPLLKLVQAMEGQHTLKEVPGLIYADETGLVHMNSFGPAISLNDLAPPDFDGLPLSEYWAPELFLPILGSRDCYWKDCAFCDHYMQYASFRTRKPEKVAEDIQFLQRKYGIRNFQFADETLSPNYGRQFAKAVKERQLDIRWYAMARLQKGFDEETARTWYESGCIYLMMGLESANPELAKSMVKGTDNAITEEVYRNLHKAGVFTFAFLFFGFPGETLQSALDTLKFIRQHRDIINSTWSGVFSLKKNSPIFRELERYGITELNPQDLSDDWATSLRYKVKAGMGYDEAKLFHKRFQEALWDIYQVPFWMVQTSRVFKFLYLAHYGKDWMLKNSFRDPAESALKTALAYFCQGQYLEAEQIYQQVLAQNPEHVYALNYLGVLRLRQQQLPAAFALIQQALQLEPTYPEARLALGLWYLQQGQMAQARNYFEQTLQLEPYIAEAYYRLAQLFVPPDYPEQDLQRLEKALKLCERARMIRETDEAVEQVMEFRLSPFDCQGLQAYYAQLLRLRHPANAAVLESNV